MRHSHLIAAAAALCALCSCSKEGAKLFEGYYSYKMSGELSYTATSPADESAVVTAPDELTFKLQSESGQMNILCRDRKSGSMTLTLNAVGGDVYVVDATAEGSALRTSEMSKTFKVTDSGLSFTGKLDVVLDGEGERLDDVVLLHLRAKSGTLRYLGRDYNVSSSRIECVAKEND